jgi:hypothetical protein
LKQQHRAEHIRREHLPHHDQVPSRLRSIQSAPGEYAPVMRASPSGAEGAAGTRGCDVPDAEEGGRGAAVGPKQCEAI